MRRAPSIVLPIVLLVVAAVAVASAVQFAITFNGPPPFPRPVPVAAVAAALRDGDAGPWRRRLSLATGPLEATGVEGGPNRERDAAVAQALDVPVREIRGTYQLARGPARGEIMGDFAIEWRSGGAVRTVKSVRPWFTAWHMLTLSATLAVLAILALLAWYLARRISRPIARLAEAAGKARLGNPTVIPHEGPREVRALADAIDRMQGRILEQAEGRTAMLAAIAHDIGTPLSRIAFWIEQLPDTARERAAMDIAEMRDMLQSGLRFARDARADADRPRLELGSLIESLVDDMAGAAVPVSSEGGPRIVMRGDPAALRRMFANLIDNAVRYGRTASVGWTLSQGAVEVQIDDAGPGFDPDATAPLFEPFVRGDPSRNRATGGTGLGLAIVRSIAQAHGGAVRVRLPID
jgi:signal transduction histidine kinase